MTKSLSAFPTLNKLPSYKDHEISKSQTAALTVPSACDLHKNIEMN